MEASVGTRPTRPDVGLRLWLVLSLVAAGLAFAGSMVSLSVDGIYSVLTPAFLDQALAQDVANLLLAAPVLAVSAALAGRGSFRAVVVWIGALAFTVYSYVIYTLAVPFGALFPLWVAVLGLSLFALVGALSALDSEAAAAHFTSGRAVTVCAWVLLVVSVLFGLLWLSEDVPALLEGSTPRSVSDLATPTQPVHVLDYAFFVPAGITVAVQLLRRRAFAFAAAPAFLVFLAMTCLPILLTPVIQNAREQPAAWSLTAPVGVLSVGLLSVLTWVLGTVHDRTPTPTSDGARHADHR